MIPRCRNVPVVWTIGHSNMEIDDFLGLLHTHGIRCVVDVRSAPYSRHVPHFNRTEIKRALESAGIRYLFMGDALGGRIKDEDGARPRTYAQAIADPSFHSGIDTLLNEAGEAHTAVMCAEKDPNRCHRRHIIAAVLDERDVTVRHILSDGKTVTERELMGLFGKKT